MTQEQHLGARLVASIKIRGWCQMRSGPVGFGPRCLYGHTECLNMTRKEIARLADHIAGKFRGLALHEIIAFNDARGRTVDEVIAAVKDFR